LASQHERLKLNSSFSRYLQVGSKVLRRNAKSDKRVRRKKRLSKKHLKLMNCSKNRQYNNSKSHFYLSNISKERKTHECTELEDKQILRPAIPLQTRRLKVISLGMEP
jgi:hypothetical protein